jgi:GABA(A) receptor-associated protein
MEGGIRSEALRVKKKYPNFCPIYCESRDLQLDKQKYLIHKDMSFSQLIYIIRKRLKLTPENGLFFLIKSPTEGDILARSSDIIYSLYDKHKDPQTECLYITIAKESTFGA